MTTPAPPVPQTLASKVAVVSGSSHGIGAAIAQELSSRGASLVLNYPTPDLEDTAEQLGNSLAGSFASVCADISTADGPAKLIDAAVKAFGKIDILINSAGRIIVKPFEEQTLEDFTTLVNTNLRGMWLLTQAALPHLPKKEEGGGGRIVNMCSGVARQPMANQSTYCATKGAIDSLTKEWARELPPKYGCTVNSVAPGPIETPGMRGCMTAEEMAVVQPQMEMATPVAPRVGKPEEVAWAVAFLCEERSRWINGESLFVSGGLVID
ncbi:hypothetical protein W97_07362 [Coniosporium apollinis CBS 100218]|uniref:Ketoreductase domain-containing protein n=1 Tax=Coniosporium apollinis (strain CBS 100218) TaxID=1168221 RepID=R7Z0Y3_CONA1|nr:uncharacterized protein W97_07362 [Coniosporium apollinis CBS 100218]EON67865.1 hypothetical protein W97_07362 [Coniosporium apollinis CBS 100218]